MIIDLNEENHHLVLQKKHKGMHQARAKGTTQLTIQALLTSIATNIVKINNYLIKNEKNN